MGARRGAGACPSVPPALDQLTAQLPYDCLRTVLLRHPSLLCRHPGTQQPGYVTSHRQLSVVLGIGQQGRARYQHTAGQPVERQGLGAPDFLEQCDAPNACHKEAALHTRFWWSLV